MIHPAPPTLAELPLADLSFGQLLETASYAEFAGEKSEASWLPTEEYARKWQEFCHTGMLRSP
jgi:hypothetical protein